MAKGPRCLMCRLEMLSVLAAGEFFSDFMWWVVSCGVKGGAGLISRGVFLGFLIIFLFVW